MRLTPLARWGKAPTDPAHIARWNTSRESVSRADYASPVTRYAAETRLWEAVAGVLLAVVIGVGLAAALVAWWVS